MKKTAIILKRYFSLGAAAGAIVLVRTLSVVLGARAQVTDTTVFVPSLFFLASIIIFSVLVYRLSQSATTSFAQRCGEWTSSNWTKLMALVTISAFGAILWLVANSSSSALIMQRIQPVVIWILLIACLAIALVEEITQNIKEKLLPVLLKQPVYVWVLVGYIFAFAFLYLSVFLLATGRLDFPEQVMSSEPIGDDLRKFLGYSTSALLEGRYVGNYPPFPLLFFFPLSWIDLRSAYHLLTIGTFISYLYIAFGFPLLVSKSIDKVQTVLLLGATGLFSYGLHWELENGQFNLLAFAFCLVSIYLFHFKRRQRLLAYVLFSIALQLKLWPGIFVLMLVEDWGDWKANAKRVFALLAVNFAALFILGPGVFQGFLQNIVTGRFSYLWVGNHSIESFLTVTSQSLSWVSANQNWLQSLWLFLVVASILILVIQAWRKGQKGFNALLFFACTLGALLIPSISNDYKLPILVAPTIVYINSMGLFAKKHRRSAILALILLITIAYSMTTYSIGVRPSFLDNSAPMLSVMLLLVVISDFMIAKKQRLN